MARPCRDQYGTSGRPNIPRRRAASALTPRVSTPIPACASSSNGPVASATSSRRTTRSVRGSTGAQSAF
eukprot:5765272-Pyramimonas_sp.AAC.1